MRNPRLSYAGYGPADNHHHADCGPLPAAFRLLQAARLQHLHDEHESGRSSRGWMSNDNESGRSGRSRGSRGGPFGGHGGPFGEHGGPFGGRGGPGGPGAGPFGRPPFGGGWRASKAKRGDVRTAVLSVLADEPRNGYQVIQQIAERTDGAWKPSPGSVYPTLQQLEDEGLVRLEENDGKRLYHLTDAGRTYVTEHADELAATWETASDSSGAPPTDMLESIGLLASAVWQVTHNGTHEQRASARELLERTRRDLYRILADSDPAADGPDDSSS